jgi:hypothetical protein
MCHTRIMPDGFAVKEAQGNFPFDCAFAEDYRSNPASTGGDRLLQRLLYNTPWFPDPQREYGLDLPDEDRRSLIAFLRTL